MSEFDLDQIILNVVKHFGIIRRKDLFDRIEKENKEQKVTLITFNRRMKSLVKLKELKLFKYPEYLKLGLFPKDKRSSYVTSLRVARDIEHYDEVFKLLEGKDLLKKKNALIEIESMRESTILTPAQLNLLSALIGKEDIKLTENIIRIIYNSIEKNKIFPSNLEMFEKNLTNFLKKHERRGISDNTHNHIIYLLGLLDSPFVVDLLKIKIRDYMEDFDSLKHKGYASWTIARLLDDSKKELFEFQNSLNEERSKVVFNVRSQAQSMLSTYDFHYPKFKEKLKELEDYDKEILGKPKTAKSQKTTKTTKSRKSAKAIKHGKQRKTTRNKGKTAK